MRIKRLEIHGFKSFVDKTHFQFGGGMTAVVGPNGCGKSNIVDAILWCMGEQSPKHLRGKDMQDVIFAGSERLAPAGLAEVSLFFAMDEGPKLNGDLLAADFPVPVLAPGERPKKTIDQLEAEAEEASRRAGLIEVDENAPPAEDGADATLESAADAVADAVIAAVSEVEAAADLAPRVTDAPIITLGGFTEVQVTRRLYRSGESEYLMNKTPCRLRDIHELFMDAGIGKGAYSIIEQGKVGMIVSSKPEDRRIFIEEAAGISKFKSRKKQAMSKIEQTEQNLLRVHDIVTELAKQMGSLDRQAKKAERYRKLRDEIREVDLKVAAAEFERRTRDLGAEQAALTELKEREVGAAAEIGTLENDVESSRGRLVEEERELSSVQEQLFAANNQIKLDQQNLDYAIREIEKIKSAAETATADITRLEADVAHIVEETTRSMAEKQVLEGEVAEKTQALASQAGQVEESKRLQRELSQQIDDVKSRIVESMQAMNSARNALVNLEKRTGDLRNRLERGQSERDEVSDRVETSKVSAGEAASALAELKQLKLGLEQERGEHAALLDQLRVDLKAAIAETQTLGDDLGRKRNRLQSLGELQNSYEGYQKGVRAVMARAGVTGSSLGPDVDDEREPEGPITDGGATMMMAADGASAIHTAPEAEKNPIDLGVYGLVADLIETPMRFETAVESVLGERLQAVLVKSHVEGADAIRFLREQANGRGTFLPLDLTVAVEGSWPDLAQDGVLGRLIDQVHVRPEYMDVAKVLLGDVIVVDTLDRAIALHAKEKAHRKTYVTLEGEVVDAAGALTGGSREGLTTGLLQRKREIKELTKQVADLEQAHAQKVLSREQIAKRLAQIEDTLRALQKSEQEETIRILTHEKDLATLRERLDRDRQRQEVIEFEAEQLRAQMEEAADEKAAAEQKIVEETAKKEAADAELISVQERAREASAGIEALAASETHLKVALAEIRSRRDSLAANLQRFERNKQELEVRLARLTENLERGAREQIDITSQAETLEASIDEKTKQAEALRNELLEMREKFDGESHALREREANIKNLRTRLEELKAGISGAQIRETQLQMNLQHATQQTMERYNEDLAANFQAWIDPGLDFEAATLAVADLKEKISKLGEVNLTAIEEHADVAKRHDELAKQKEDLEQTLTQLKETIAKINRTSKERFLETFEKVNANFQELFPKLFRGGKAHLVLTNETDLLEAGIDIVAQPPGKKLQNINLLSGGEKALTAVSLIMAIFLVRPTPFCILDEVDAPLDEANVGRYNDIVREMANNTQFIVITHNKRTMAICDALYGITMEEPGCSKTVTVKFDGEKMRQRIDQPASSPS